MVGYGDMLRFHAEACKLCKNILLDPQNFSELVALFDVQRFASTSSTSKAEENHLFTRQVTIACISHEKIRIELKNPTVNAKAN